VFGLPGNPVAAFLGFELFIGPLIRRLSGESEYRTTWFDGVAAGDFGVRSDRTFFSASRVVYGDGIWRAFPVESRGSADIFSVVGTNAFVRFEEGRYTVPAGEKVRFFFQRGKQYGTER
jgi:molybdopterin molybdotransferase